VLLDLGTYKVCVGCVYIKPKSGEGEDLYGPEFFSILQAHVVSLRDRGYEVLLCGDFNTELIHPRNPNPRVDSRREPLQDMVQFCNLSVLNLDVGTKGKYREAQKSR